MQLASNDAHDTFRLLSSDSLLRFATLSGRFIVIEYSTIHVRYHKIHNPRGSTATILAFQKVANRPESHRFELELVSALSLDLLRTRLGTPSLRPSQKLLKEAAYCLALALALMAIALLSLANAGVSREQNVAMTRSWLCMNFARDSAKAWAMSDELMTRSYGKEFTRKEQS